jgi:hypothetical protein
MKVLGQIDDLEIASEICYQKHFNIPLTIRQIQYLSEASTHVRFDFVPKAEHYEEVREILGIFADVQERGLSFFVERNNFAVTLNWLRERIQNPESLGSGERYLLQSPLNELFSFGSADNTLKYLLGIPVESILEENIQLLRSTNSENSGNSAFDNRLDYRVFQPVPKRVSDLRRESWPPRRIFVKV